MLYSVSQSVSILCVIVLSLWILTLKRFRSFVCYFILCLDHFNWHCGWLQVSNVTDC